MMMMMMIIIIIIIIIIIKIREKMRCKIRNGVAVVDMS